MFDGDTDYYKINRRLRRRKWQKHLSFLWALLIIPLGFVLYFVARHGRQEPAHRMVTMASPVRAMPMHRPTVVAQASAMRAPAAAPHRTESRKAKMAARKRVARHHKTRASAASSKSSAHRGSIGNPSTLVKD